MMEHFVKFGNVLCLKQILNTEGIENDARKIET
jgi:hypothetical protein